MNKQKQKDYFRNIMVPHPQAHEIIEKSKDVFVEVFEYVAKQKKNIGVTQRINITDLLNLVVCIVYLYIYLVLIFVFIYTQRIKKGNTQR